MATEPNTDLTLSPPGPLQTDLIVNPVIRRIAAVGGNTVGVIDRGLNTPPGSPSEGDTYIVGTSPNELWTGHANAIAYWNTLTWDFYTPSEGWTIAVLDENVDYRFDGSAWQPDTSMTNPMTTAGDIIRGGTAGAPTRVAIGTEGQVLQVSSGIPAWTNVGSGVSSVNGGSGAVIVPVPIIIACSDETTPLTAGTNKVKFRMPYAFTLTEIPRAGLSTAQSTSGAGGLVTVDINASGSSILSTKLTIDNTETTSKTAATPAVLSDTTLADDEEVTFDINLIGDGTARGLKVTLIGYKTP